MQTYAAVDVFAEARRIARRERARFVAAARLEYLAEIICYTEAQPGLGGRFAQAVEDAIAPALLFPTAGSPSPARTRRVLVKGFPFSL